MKQSTNVDATRGPRAQLHQKRPGRTRSGHASNQEGQSVVLRHESPYRGRCPVRPGAVRGRHRYQCGRCHDGRSVAAGRGRRRFWRYLLYWRAQASRTPIASSALVDCHAACQRKERTHSGDDQQIRLVETVKAKIRVKVEHPFGVIKQQFGYLKTRYRGLKKNTAHLRHCSGWPTSGWRERFCCRGAERADGRVSGHSGDCRSEICGSIAAKNCISVCSAGCSDPPLQ